MQSLIQNTPGFESEWALFLDVDGTLLELTMHPDDVHVSKELMALLEKLKLLNQDALALISGRPVQELDRLFDPLQFCAAGQHGLERRDVHGQLHHHPMPDGEFDRVRQVLAEFAANHTGIVLEDKTASIAMHYRQAPQYRLPLASVIDHCMQQLGDDFHLQSGKMVFEIKPRGRDKGSAIAEFMGETPFKGRKPVFIGDDITDEDGFRIVNKLGGYSIKVGDGDSIAMWHLQSASAVLEWLLFYNEYLTSRESV